MNASCNNGLFPAHRVVDCKTLLSSPTKWRNQRTESKLSETATASGAPEGIAFSSLPVSWTSELLETRTWTAEALGIFPAT